MKNLLFILSLSSLILFSCSSDGDGDSPVIDDDNVLVTIDDNNVLLKSTTSINKDGSTGTIKTYTYNDNKIDRIYTNDTYRKYTYEGEFITKAEYFTSNDEPLGGGIYSFFTYEGNNMTEVESHILYYGNIHDNTTYHLIEYFNYKYNNDGTVTLTSPDYDERADTYFFSTDGQLIRDERSIDSNITNTFYYTYDNKKNPLKNIIGFGLIPPYKNIHNKIREEQINQEGVTFTYELNYIYNSQDYPTSKTDKRGNTTIYEYY